MKRYAFIMKLRDESVIEEYERLHEIIGKDVLDAHSEVGMRNYTIYRDGLTLFAYFEAQDPKGALEELAKSPVMPGWWKLTGPLMQVDKNGKPIMKELGEAFHMD